MRNIFKYLVISGVLIGLLFLGSLAWSAPGDRVDPHNNALWQLAAVGFVAKTIDTANNLSSDWRSWEDINIMRWWLLIEAGQPYPAGTGKIYQKGTYGNFLGKFQYFSFGDSIDVEVNPVYAPPENASVATTTISCDNPLEGTVRLYKLVASAYFVEQAVDGVINGDRLDFSGLSAGLYVLGFSDDLNRLPTAFLQVQ